MNYQSKCELQARLDVLRIDSLIALRLAMKYEEDQIEMLTDSVSCDKVRNTMSPY